MKFIKIGNMDFQLKRAFKRNTSFGNFIIPISGMTYFTFKTNDGVSIQSEDFYLQKIRYNSGTGLHTFVDYLQLNNTYKGTSYFEEYDFVSNIPAGCYGIRAGSYYSVTLFEAVNISVILTGVVHGDINNDYFGDTNGDYFGETI